MATINKKVSTPKLVTHEGAPASRITPEQALRRAVMSCLLWEDEFYESGVAIAQRISELIEKVLPEKVAQIAIEAREKMKLRHVPLLIVNEMTKYESHKGWVGDTLARVIQRADELTEFLAIYFARPPKPYTPGVKHPLSKQVKKGLAAAFTKFSAYDLAKYDRDHEVKLKDVLFLTHPKPSINTEDSVRNASPVPAINRGKYKRGPVFRDPESLFEKLITDTLPVPDTHEVAISAIGHDKTLTEEQKAEAKRDEWHRLLKENKLGSLALLRNLRNMQEVRVDMGLIAAGLDRMKVERVLPFRFISAAKYAPQLESNIEAAMFRCLKAQEPIIGPTALLVDHSGSMQQTVSGKSEISRFDAASAVGILLREVCESFRVFTFSDFCIEVPARHGFALREAIMSRINPVGTLLGKAVNHVYDQFLECERLIVITDEQSADPAPNPHGRGYVINVASNQNGVGYGSWNHIDGWSEAVIDYLREFERAEQG